MQILTRDVVIHAPVVGWLILPALLRICAMQAERSPAFAIETSSNLPAGLVCRELPQALYQFTGLLSQPYTSLLVCRDTTGTGGVITVTLELPQPYTSFWMIPLDVLTNAQKPTTRICRVANVRQLHLARLLPLADTHPMAPRWIVITGRDKLPNGLVIDSHDHHRLM
jgi:hypothetical protein